jgi:uncharacterized protein (DUF697 family)
MTMVQRFGAFDNVRTMVGVLREVSLDEIRHQAETMPRLMVVAPTTEDARRLGSGLTGPEGEYATSYRAVNEPVNPIPGLDAIVVWDPERTGANSRVAEAVRYESPVIPIVSYDGFHSQDNDAIERTRADILKRNPERTPAFGRFLPSFRSAATKQLIDETAAANAQFSLVSNIPAVLPVIGNIAAAGADFIVLTKNQVMMLYKLAAVHGRDLSDQRSILQEVLPVVGAGLFWRTVAREAAALLPFAAGTIPKVVIAYVGTMVVGRAAEYFYRTGLKPTRQHLKLFARQAIETLRHLDLPGVKRFFGNKRSGGDSAIPEAIAPKRGSEWLN